MITLRGTDNWKVDGVINLTPSDSIYQKLVEAVNSDCLGQEYLQKITGHNNPIVVDRGIHLIQFC